MCEKCSYHILHISQFLFEYCSVERQNKTITGATFCCASEAKDNEMTKNGEQDAAEDATERNGGTQLPSLPSVAESAVDRALFTAFAEAASPNTLRAFRTDIVAFDQWCWSNKLVPLPASPQTIADFLRARAEEGAAPASLARYKASIAKLHRLCRAVDPCQDELVKLVLTAHQRKIGVAQKQARGLRFRGGVKDPLADSPRGINVRATLEACGTTPPELRDKALLSVAYDTGLRASELVAIQVEDIIEALDPDARLLKISRSKGDQQGEGATAYLSPRSVAALTAWLDLAGIGEGAVFRRVVVRRYAGRPATRIRNTAPLSWNGRWDGPLFVTRDAVAARVEYDIGDKPLHPGSVTPMLRAMLRRAFEAKAFDDLDADTFTKQLSEISAHSTRVGVNQDYFASGEDLAGIMDALRWKSPRMPLLYNRNLAAEQGAAGRLLSKLL
jgi:site-specific recombinase XerD